jgi:hypothetical protein
LLLGEIVAKEATVLGSAYLVTTTTFGLVCVVLAAMRIGETNLRREIAMLTDFDGRWAWGRRSLPEVLRSLEGRG